MFGRIVKGYLAGAAIGATFATFLEADYSNEFEEKHKDRYSRSVREWKRDYVSDRLVFYFTRILTYPITSCVIMVADRTVQNRMNRERDLKELEELHRD